MARLIFLLASFFYLLMVFLFTRVDWHFLWLLALGGPFIVLGFMDLLQKKQAIRKNFPVIGRLRYWFEAVRPEINQYFVESNTSGSPFNREDRSLVYQRAKGVLDTLPFGTQKNVYDVGYEWLNHSMAPVHVDPNSLRVLIGGADCKQPYNASLLNISAMSYGALSKNAIAALNLGAKMGDFAHDTGEGGISPHHRKGGDLIWQIGTGYFGCRKADGTFDAKSFEEKSQYPEVKMIEIKISQGAKPGHGGILPKVKITDEISFIRQVGKDKDIISPPAHSAYKTPIELLEYVQELRNLSGGKPVGFKLCIGKRQEFFSICKAMLKTGIKPDFITVDGGEGGTGAAPLEFSNNVGAPLIEGLVFVSNALTGCGLKEDIKIIAAGKITTGFGIIKRLAVGADLCFSARAMMLALGCIQALKCNTNHCPTGVATQKPGLVAGLNVEDKKYRVSVYHRETIESVAELLGAMSAEKTEDLRRWNLFRRINFTEVKNYAEIYPYLKKGQLLAGGIPPHYLLAWNSASPDSFKSIEGVYA